MADSQNEGSSPEADPLSDLDHCNDDVFTFHQVTGTSCFPFITETVYTSITALLRGSSDSCWQPPETRV
jgi:hypothetical protein